MNYLQFEFDNVNKDESEILVALLADGGFESFEEKDNSLFAFIKEDDLTEAGFEEIIKVVPVKYKVTVVTQQNWNAQWESSFEPIIVNDFVRRTPWVAIRAGFHQAIHQVKHEIIITPKMSFGTGHHATTYMMIEQMEALDFTNKAVLDFGTGTAVLAILAEKMGAKFIDAIDYDEYSIENSIENIAANNCSGINLIQANTIDDKTFYDIILANINLNVIMENLAVIRNVCKKGSLILLSGFIKEDETVMIKALGDYGFQQLKTIQKGEWICIITELC